MSSVDQRPDPIVAAVAERARRMRIIQGLTQAELGARAGLGTATIQRFEASGHGALETVVRIAIALRAEASLEGLFAAPKYASLDEALARPGPLVRKRVRPRRKGPA